MIRLFILFVAIFQIGCLSKVEQPNTLKQDNHIISRSEYKDKLEGFWLGQCIGNWTGLITEMDKIGNIGAIKTGKFYTRADWGNEDLPSIWSEGQVSDISNKIQFEFKGENEIWGSDDDTDIEYIYQYLLHQSDTVILSPLQIKNGWLSHIKPEEENYLWVSNQRSYDLMKEGVLPPNTSNPEVNEHYEMIDAQLTTEIFGLFSPTRPDIAVEIADLPIKTTARKNAEWISKFYVTMHSLSILVDADKDVGLQILDIANMAREQLPDNSYSAKMYDYVLSQFRNKNTWEETRDSVYERYQVQELDGYDITSKNLYCNGCFAAGINFASSLVSLFYGRGDIKETIKIGTLAGWDSDNPTATWGGLLGFIYGKKRLGSIFDRNFSKYYNIHRTRINFPNNGIDSFENMALVGSSIVEKVILQKMGGRVDTLNNIWIIPKL